MRRLRTLPPASTAGRAQHSPARCSEPEPRLRGAHRGGAAAPQGPRSSEQLGGPHFLWGARAFPATPPALLPVSEVRAWGGGRPSGRGLQAPPHAPPVSDPTPNDRSPVRPRPSPLPGPKAPLPGAKSTLAPGPLHWLSPCAGLPLLSASPGGSPKCMIQSLAGGVKE